MDDQPPLLAPALSCTVAAKVAAPAARCESKMLGLLGSFRRASFWWVGSCFTSGGEIIDFVFLACLRVIIGWRRKVAKYKSENPDTIIRLLRII